MQEITIKAPAKINLGLDCKGTLPNGYHDLCMVMQTVDVCDEIRIEKTSEAGATMEANVDFLPLDGSNLCIKAANALLEKYPQTKGVHIVLNKTIPAAAGLAGGSTDAAAVLYGVNELFELGLSRQQLKDIGVTLGADIPYCLQMGTALAEGIGEKLTELPALEGVPVLLAKPGIDVSTKFVYTHFDELENPTHPDNEAIIAATKNADIKTLSKVMQNNLELVTIPAHPVIDEIKKCMIENGALGAMMSGSGPTVFGLFENDKDMEKCREAVEKSNLALDIRTGHTCKALY